MLALHSPHMDKLVLTDSDEEDGGVDDSMYEKAFRVSLGTRPPLPADCPAGSESYRTVLEIFAFTNEDPEKRPTAEEILALVENKEDLDDSILCVKMVQATYLCLM